MNTVYLILGLLIMSGVTYLTRVLTMVLFRKPIKNIYIKSFLYYLPYCVLAVMIFPAIFFSTDNFFSAALGSAAALILSYFRKGLALVAVVSILTVFLAELIF